MTFSEMANVFLLYLRELMVSGVKPLKFDAHATDQKPLQSVRHREPPLVETQVPPPWLCPRCGKKFSPTYDPETQHNFSLCNECRRTNVKTWLQSQRKLELVKKDRQECARAATEGRECPRCGSEMKPYAENDWF